VFHKCDVSSAAFKHTQNKVCRNWLRAIYCVAMTPHPKLCRNIGSVAITKPQVVRYPELQHRLDASLAQVAGTIDAPEHWLEIPIGKGWIAAYRLQHTGRGSRRRTTQILEVRVFPDEHGDRRAGEWSAAVLGTPARKPRMAFSFERVRRGITERSFNAALAATGENASRQGASHVFGTPGTRHGGSRREGRGAGRPRLRDNAFYAKLAVRYDAIEHSDRREPGESTRRTLAKTYQQQLGHTVTENNIGKWLQQAYALGFLTPSLQGSRRRRATKAARDLLASATAASTRRPPARSAEGR
jgi:hypothetical protein